MLGACSVLVYCRFGEYLVVVAVIVVVEVIVVVVVSVVVAAIAAVVIVCIVFVVVIGHATRYRSSVRPSFVDGISVVFVAPSL